MGMTDSGGKDSIEVFERKKHPLQLFGTKPRGVKNAFRKKI